ncbi:AraC family ligand binding domain-containing protein [Dyadobacter luticola]|uniref:AraC-type arabinose-binding/dimerisation domain-containing protein n=1 Tax=Dyadobacter luticola TaxID=1979387 RepID=A0A5R9L619_9BACT|nr:AraC family ligand binding domain-containing protein [Dyadobacter luticola]TLV03851.1 hypothetical protein FEN17_09725 [Dyadobacter luticola]
MSTIQFNARKKFHLLQAKTRNWETKPEHLEHYRIIFVMSGEGNFILADQIRNYARHGIIFLKPGQRVIFQEDRETEVFMIAFDTYLAEDFQRKKAYTPDFADTYKQAENLCNAPRLIQGKALQNEHDEQMINYLISQMSFEVIQRSVSHVKLIQGSVDLFVTILARNNFASKKIDEKASQQTVADGMIEYLRQELHQNKSIRIPELLMRFNISEEAANLCIMNKTGMSLRNFIFKYKADLFKSRMLKIDVLELSPYLRPH